MNRRYKQTKSVDIYVARINQNPQVHQTVRR